MTVASIVGTVVAFLFVQMQSLGQDNWKIAAALMGSYIGGCKLSGNVIEYCFWIELLQQM